MNVLIAEDDKISREMAKRLVESLGHQCTTAANGAAVEKARGGLFDAIIMDVQMPVMDGEAATTLIRTECTSPNGAPPYVIVATAEILGQTKERPARTGASNQILQPIRTERLSSALAQVSPSSDPSGADSAQIDGVRFATAIDPSMPEAVEIYRDFRVETTRDLDQLSELIRTEATSELLALCHRLRGTASILGYRGLAALLRDLETSAGAGMLAAADTTERLGEIRTAMAEALAWSDHRLGISTAANQGKE